MPSRLIIDWVPSTFLALKLGWHLVVYPLKRIAYKKHDLQQQELEIFFQCFRILAVLVSDSRKLGFAKASL